VYSPTGVDGAHAVDEDARAAQHLDVAVHVDPFEKANLKPVSHVIGSRAETRRLSGMGQGGSTCTAPPTLVMRGAQLGSHEWLMYRAFPPRFVASMMRSSGTSSTRGLYRVHMYLLSLVVVKRLEQLR
jgi:hypothetical protein